MPLRCANLAGLGRFAVAELGEDLQDAVEMGQTGAKTVDEFIEHELALFQTAFAVGDLFGQIVQKLRLNAAERFRCRAAGSRQFRIGVLPLLQFIGTLFVGCVLLLNHLLQKPILLLLSRDQMPQKIDRDLVLALAWFGLRFGGNIDPKDGRKGFLVVGRHEQKVLENSGRNDSPGGEEGAADRD